MTDQTPAEPDPTPDPTPGSQPAAETAETSVNLPPTPPVVAATPWRQRVLGMRGVLAVSLASLVVGGLGGAAVTSVIGGDDDRDGWHDRMHDGRGEGHFDRMPDGRLMPDGPGGWNQGPNQMGPNQMAPNQMGPNQVGPNQVGPNQIGPDRVAPSQSADSGGTNG